MEVLNQPPKQVAVEVLRRIGHRLTGPHLLSQVSDHEFAVKGPQPLFQDTQTEVPNLRLVQ